MVRLFVVLGLLMGSAVILAAYLIDLLTRKSGDSGGLGSH
jgi:phage shock protein PspC (stress-responsive transcriptional regulator)